MAIQELTVDSKVQVMEPCAECGGSGVTELRGWCRMCGANPSQAELEAADDVQPCGHPWGARCEVDGCGECDGKGRITRWVTLDEVATFIAGQLAAAVSCEHARPRAAFTTTRK